MKKSSQIEELFIKYINETISEKERVELMDFVNEEENNELWQEIIESHYKQINQRIPDTIQQKSTHIVHNTWKQIETKLNNQQVNRPQDKVRSLRKLLQYAAAVFVLFTGLGLWYNYQTQEAIDTNAELQDIQAGSNRATLSLSGGTSIALSESQGTVVINEQGVSYQDGTSILETENIQIATLVTPRAGQYQVILPDGSKVWLNASTSLKYPTQFGKNERRVELDGEAYFEIKENRIKDSNGSIRKLPFIVETSEQNVIVLGTQFNITAYDDEKTTKTTLVEGSVKVKQKETPTSEHVDKEIILRPGQQSNLTKKQLLVYEVNTMQHTSWKDGIIMLERQSVEEVLRQLERWYDVQFVFSKNIEIPNKTLSGEVLRELPLSTFLGALEEQTNLKFERNERRILVKN